MDRISVLIDGTICYFAGDPRRVNHFLKVHSFAKTIGMMEKLDNAKQEILEAAAVVHDSGIKVSEQKYHSSAGKYQELEGPAVARELLEKAGFSEAVIERACFLVGHHHTYNAIDDIDFQILVEADFLVNIYEDEMTRDTIVTVRDKYFKTETGKRYLEQLYLSIGE